MLIRRPPDIVSSGITPPEIYRARRRFIRGVGAVALGAGLGVTRAEAGAQLPAVRPDPHPSREARTPYRDITTYNNPKNRS